MLLEFKLTLSNLKGLWLESVDGIIQLLNNVFTPSYPYTIVYMDTHVRSCIYYYWTSLWIWFIVPTYRIFFKELSEHERNVEII